MRIFVTGANGQIARSLREAAGDTGEVLHCAARPTVDLARPDTILPAMAAFGPDLVINPAAYTAVDRAESEPGLAFAVNRDGAAAVAEASDRLGVPLIHLSTDYVFDGAKAEPYLEDDPVAPQGVYGRSKLAGEEAVARANGRHIILRTAWVYAPFGANFVGTMLRLAAERDALRVVDDQVGCPTYAPDIAAAILAIGQRITEGGWRGEFAGVTHLAGPRAVTWCEFARMILAENARRGGRSPPVQAIATSEYPTAARRPANSRLSTARLAALFGVQLPSLEASLANCIERMARQDA